ncbi:MAG: anti-sigma B factor antagonist [Candidatus Omnitrophota bacterium]|jgi:anti-sigma B factor antagonist
MSLQITLEKKDHGYCLVLKGHIDHASTPSFEAQSSQLLELNPKRVLIDMQGVDYVSSAGIGALFQLTKAIKDQGGVVSLYRPQSQVRDIIEIVKAIPLEDIFYDEEDADAMLKTLQDFGKALPPKKDDELENLDWPKDKD